MSRTGLADLRVWDCCSKVSKEKVANEIETNQPLENLVIQWRFIVQGWGAGSSKIPWRGRSPRIHWREWSSRVLDIIKAVEYVIYFFSKFFCNLLSKIILVSLGLILLFDKRPRCCDLDTFWWWCDYCISHSQVDGCNLRARFWFPRHQDHEVQLAAQSTGQRVRQPRQLVLLYWTY